MKKILYTLTIILWVITPKNLYPYTYTFDNNTENSVKTYLWVAGGTTPYEAVVKPFSSTTFHTGGFCCDGISVGQVGMTYKWNEESKSNNMADLLFGIDFAASMGGLGAGILAGVTGVTVFGALSTLLTPVSIGLTLGAIMLKVDSNRNLHINNYYYHNTWGYDCRSRKFMWTGNKLQYEHTNALKQFSQMEKNDIEQLTEKELLNIMQPTVNAMKQTPYYHYMEQVRASIKGGGALYTRWSQESMTWGNNIFSLTNNSKEMIQCSFDVTHAEKAGLFIRNKRTSSELMSVRPGQTIKIRAECLHKLTIHNEFSKEMGHLCKNSSWIYKDGELTQPGVQTGYVKRKRRAQNTY